MDFLDPKKKRSNKIKLYLGYILIAIAITMGVTVLLFANAGYRLDRNGDVTQNGLLFVSSHPSGADSYIEGIYSKKKYHNKTNTKFDLREGRYKVTLKKDGYRSWQREMNIEGGFVERLAYPFLFPDKLESVNMKTYDSAPNIVSSSPDRKWIVIQQPNNFLNFDVFNAGEPEKPVSTFSIPSSLLTVAKGTQSLKVVEWSSDNTNILIKHSFDDQNEFVIVNKDKPETSVNINMLTGQKPFDVTLKDRKIDKLYLHMASDGLLQLVDLKSRVLTPIVQRVYDYKSHGDDMLVYVTNKDTNSAVVSVRIKTKDKDYELRELPANTTYVTDVAKFDNAWYVVTGASSDNKVYVYKDPLTILGSDNLNKAMFARTLRIDDPKEVSFSANARFLVAQSEQEFAIYDAEMSRQYRYKINDKFDTDRPVEWMDGHRLATSTSGMVFIFDFDGINQQKLMPINNATDVMFDRDYENAFTLSKPEKDGKSSLVKTKLLVAGD